MLHVLMTFNHIFTLYLSQICIFTCSITISCGTKRILLLITCSKSWPTITQIMSLLWHLLRVIFWILLLKSNYQYLDHPWINTYARAWHVWVSHKKSIFISYSWLYHIYLFKSMNLMLILKVYISLYGIYTWIQHTWTTSVIYGIFLHINSWKN
jgi:hypothetical protein